MKEAVVTEEPAPSAWDVADVDKRDAIGRTALLNACEKGDHSICRLLLIQRAAPDVCTSDGQSPLYLACRTGSLEVVRMLLMRQRGVLNMTTHSGFSPLFAVAQKGHMALLQLLLEERADVNLNAKDGRTPLYAACECGHDAIATRLLRMGIPVDARRTGGSTALVAAVRARPRHTNSSPNLNPPAASAGLFLEHRPLALCLVSRLCVHSFVAAPGELRAHRLRSASARRARRPLGDGRGRRHGARQCLEGGAKRRRGGH